jgi:hypothetical protein
MLCVVSSLLNYKSEDGRPIPIAIGTEVEKDYRNRSTPIREVHSRQKAEVRSPKLNESNSPLGDLC